MIISNRKTIPEQDKLQEIILTEKDRLEKEFHFKDGKWDKNNLCSNIEVFGTDFIDKNLFTGLIVERKNKENFTRFILGEQGVKTVEDIKLKKQDKEQKRKLLNEKCPPFIKDKAEDDKNKFLEFSIENLNIEDIKKSLSEKKKEIENTQKILEEPQRILKLEEPKKYEPLENKFIITLDLINTLLEKNYCNIKDDALKKLQLHLDSHFIKKDEAENWLRQGISHSKDIRNGDCPFCGQSLKDATEIINTYLSYFDSAYTDFIRKIETNLLEHNQLLEKCNFLEKTKIQDALTKAKNFKELITDSDFQKELEQLEDIVTKVKEDELNIQKKQILKKVQEKCTQKNKSPHKKIESINYNSFKTNLTNYNNYFTKAKKTINKIINQVEKFKETYRDTSKIKDKITNLEKDVEELEYKKIRIEQDQACCEHKQLKKEIDNLDSNIKQLEESLEKEQSQYLESYFNEINNLFQKFGSKNFTLNQKTEKRGNMTVYSLNVKFHNKLIQNDHLKTIFSDSDRRALALAIFYAKINLKKDSEKKNLIIILDDPITSFDDNRITNSINLFTNTIKKTKQIIILTHYPNFIKRFFEIAKNNQTPMAFLKIEQNNQTSFLKDSEKENFISSEYEKTFTQIYDFINKKHNESEAIKNILRPFLENLYLPIFFSKQIKDKNVDCSNLKLMIDGLFSDNDEIRNKMHEFRETLNADSHIMTSNNPEDVRNFASEMIDYLLNIKLQ